MERAKRPPAGACMVFALAFAAQALAQAGHPIPWVGRGRRERRRQTIGKGPLVEPPYVSKLT